MGITREQFSRRATLDLETALAAAIRRRLLEATFPGAGGVGLVKFTEVFDEWPAQDDQYVAPAACVLPDGELMYGPSHPTPTLLEDTWEVRGEPGWGLYELSEASQSFEVVARAPTGAERNALKAGVETLFQDPRVLSVPSGARYGVLLGLPEYYGLQARFSIGASRKLDDGESAQKNIWQAQFTIRAEAAQVVVGPVQPFTLKTVVTECSGPIPR